MSNWCASRAALVLAFSAILLHLPGSSAQAAFPGKNGRIAFERWGVSNSNVYTMEADGSSQTLLRPRQGRSPVWSPDGSRVVFWAYIDRPTITTVDADGSDVKTLTYGKQRDITHPQWSPNGRQFVFNGFAFNVDDGSHDAFRIMIANADDGRITFVAPVPFPHRRMSRPTWSPRGDRIAFLVGSYNHPDEVWTMTPEGEDLQRLTDNRVAEYDLDWSPDGSQLLFVRMREDPDQIPRLIDSEIAVMGENGDDVSILTHTERFERSAAFSPNGKRIVFERCCYGDSETSEIFVMRADGTHVVRLTHNEVHDSAPDWQPIPPDGVGGR
jgi:TolB protein